MYKRSLSVPVSLVLSVGILILFIPNVLAGGSDEHFQLHPTGGAGAAISATPSSQYSSPVGMPEIPEEDVFQDSPYPSGVSDQVSDYAAPKTEAASQTKGSSKWYDESAKRKAAPDREEEAFQKQFSWWPTDAQPAPVRDTDRGGYWWWPDTPGQARPWGNRGYIYVRKIIFDYSEVPTVSTEQLKPSLVVKKIHNNVKIYFDFDKAVIRDDAMKVLKKAVRILEKHPETDILITGHADTRGSESYNEQLGERRADSVKQYMLSQDIESNRIRILSRGKLDAVAPVTDIVGMQKDRQAQFMVAEVVEVMIPESQRYLYEDVPQEPEVEEVTGEVRVGFTEYTVKEGDTLGELAKEVYGSVHRWEYIYNFNRDRIENPHQLKVGQVIRLPEE